MKKGFILSFDKKKLRSFTLIEIITTITIIGILATVAVVNYGPARENILDTEAQQNLRLIQAAEKLYHVRFSLYYPPNAGTAEANITFINRDLKLDLPTVNITWNYKTTFRGCVSAARTTGGLTRYWSMLITDRNPVSGADCPIN